MDTSKANNVAPAGSTSDPQRDLVRNDLSTYHNGNGDNELQEVNGDEDCLGNDSVIEESEEFKFLLSLLVENQEMRDIYEKNTKSGDFYYLVCGGIGEKVGKLYRGCASLVQHARTISKTKRKGAHKAFGHLICKVLG
ncbi:hypothetical protein POTOM_006545 [Populus tomentosa]|uniref:Uncharacterized protein n=1 Tax=Populus tomentosa TaxID=118781 RepID=A0A8X8ANP9_POPTO|nr:hypothetical protein POTOM_006545 [Populus tomentosa]